MTLAAITVLLLASAMISNYWAQTGFRFAIAVLFVVSQPVRTLLIGNWFRTEEVADANGVFNAGHVLIEAIAFWATAPLLQLLGGWRRMMWLFTALSVASTVLWTVFARDVDAPPSQRSTTSTDTRSPMQVMRHSEVWFLGLVGFGGSITWSTFVTFWPAFAGDSLGISTGNVSFVLGFATLAIVPGSLSASWILNRAGGRLRPLILGTIVQVPLYALTLGTGNLFLLTFLAIGQGLSWFYFPILMSIPFGMKGFDEREIAVATAVFFTVGSGALALGPLLAGALAEVLELRTVLAIASFAPLVSTVGAVLLGNDTSLSASKADPVK